MSVLVLGNPGVLSRELTQALDDGQREVVTLGTPDGARQLSEFAAPGAITDDHGAAALADRLRTWPRPLTGVVSLVGFGPGCGMGVSEGRLLDNAPAALHQCLQDTVLAQLVLARRLIPLLAESGRNGRYVIVGGPGSDTPWAGHGSRSIAMAATRMLAHVLHDEARPLGVRVHLVSVDAPIRGEIAGAHECPEWPSASAIARRVAQLFTVGSTELAAGPIIQCGRTPSSADSPTTRSSFDTVPELLAALRTTAADTSRK